MDTPLVFRRWLARHRLAGLLPSLDQQTGKSGRFARFYSDRALVAPHAEVSEAAQWLQPPPSAVLDLGSGITQFDIVPSLCTKLAADRRGCAPATGLPELRLAIAEALHREHGINADAREEVLVTPGATGALAAALDAFVSPGDRVVLFDPSSPVFALSLAARRAQVRHVSTWVERGCTRFSAKRLMKAFRGARMAILASPANPTGGILAAADLETIAWWAHRYDVLLVHDAIFDRFVYDEPAGALAALPKARDRALTVGSVSKSYALASARVGWLAGHHHLVRACALVAGAQGASVPTLSQELAVVALRGGSEPFHAVLREFAARRCYTAERLRSLDLDAGLPGGAFFFWVRVGQLGVSGRQFSEQLLQAKCVLVRPGEHFGPSGRDFVRLSYATDDGRLREGLRRTAEFLAAKQACQEQRAA